MTAIDLDPIASSGVRNTVSDTVLHGPRRARPVGARLFAAVVLSAGVIAGALVSPSATADVAAAVRASSGAYGDVRGHCVTYSSTGSTTMSLDITNQGFEYVAFYFRYPNGTGAWTNWATYGTQTATRGQQVPTGTAIFALFADHLGGGQWAYASQWAVFADGSYYCR